ncbi:MAG: oligosaccharide flippase family protein [Bacteroidia bacterium]|nr:oligosaccharide flippase family protein [Bacteroidia bacterium]
MNAFARDLIRVVVVNLAVKPAWILTENMVQNAIGHHEYGRYAALFALTFILATLLDPGLTSYATREIAADNPDRQKLFSTVLWIKIGLSMVFPIVVLATMTLLGYCDVELGMLLAALQICVGLTAFFRGAMQGMHLFAADAFFSVADKAFLFVPLLIFWSGLTAERFAALNFGAACASLIAAAWVVRKRLRFSPSSFRSVADTLWRSRHFALMVLLYNVLDRINPILVERRTGAEAAGLYAGAYRWFSAFCMYLWMVLPIFYAKFAKLRDHRLPTRGLPFVAIPMIWVGGFCIFHGDKLLFLFSRSAPDQLTTMSETLSILGATLILAGTHNIFSTFLTATGNENAVNVLICAAITANVVVFYAFPASNGTVAGAWGALASHAVLLVGYPTAFVRFSRTSFPLTVLTRVAVFCGVYVAILSLTQDWTWWVSVASAVGFSGVIAVLFWGRSDVWFEGDRPTNGPCDGRAEDG